MITHNYRKSMVYSVEKILYYVCWLTKRRNAINQGLCISLSSNVQGNYDELHVNLSFSVVFYKQHAIIQ